MSDGWKFCSTSELAVMAVKEVQSIGIMNCPREQRNKWLEQFKEEHKDNPLAMNVYNMLRTSAINRDKIEDSDAGKFQVNPAQPVNSIDEFCKSIEAEPFARFEYMLEQGTRNSVLFHALADRLTGQATGRICKQLFEFKDIKIEYIDSFFRNFFPIYLKRAYSWFSLDILVKANKVYPLAFRTLLQILLQDLEVSNTMINDFVLTLDETGKYEFLSTVMEIELSTDEFIHNLMSITSAYKGAFKTEFVQSYIFNSLIAHSAECLSDWNYGRLLLAYLYAVGNGQNNFDIRTVERLIEMHRSPFKRPCKTVLSDAIKALSEAAIPPSPS